MSMEPTRQHDERQAPLLAASTASTKLPAAADSSSLSASTSTSAHTRPAIPTLTGLRAVLMLHVLIRNMGMEDGVDMFGWMVGSGAIGVSTFYCLSGFILAYCYGDHRFDSWRCYGSFIGRRYARLFPIYVISQLMSLGSEVSAVKQYGMDAWTVLHWLALATGTHLWFPWPDYALSPYPMVGGYFMLNPTLWALSVVLFFYASMPLLMRAGRWFVGVDRLSELPRGKSTSRLLWLCVLCSAWIWLPLGIFVYVDNIFLLALPYFRLGEFTLGMTAAALFLSIRGKQQQRQQQQQQQHEHDVEQAVTAAQTTGRSLIDWLATTPLLNSPLVLDVVTGATILLVILLALPNVSLPEFFAVGNWAACLLCYIILALALTSSSPTSTASKTGRSGGVLSWLLTRPVMLELGAMSFCFYAFHYVPIVYAKSIGIPPNQSAAIEYCAGVGAAWLGYKFVETPVYHYLSARLPSCRCHKV